MEMDSQRTVRFFIALLICMVPMILVAIPIELGYEVGRNNTGWAMICSILLLLQLTYNVANSES